MKPCHVLSMFLTFWHLKPYVLIWFVLIKRRCSLFMSNVTNEFKSKFLLNVTHLMWYICWCGVFVANNMLAAHVSWSE